jgi:hypothetical protein
MFRAVGTFEGVASRAGRPMIPVGVSPMAAGRRALRIRAAANRRAPGASVGVPLRGARRGKGDGMLGVLMLGTLLDRFRPDSLRTRVEASIRRGTGLFRCEWLLGPEPLTPGTMQHLADDVSEWCRETMAETRRPYGIDQVALALACAVPGGEPIASTTFGVFRPVEFYLEDGVGARLGEYLRSLALDVLNDRGEQPIRFAVALFSWGDVARETVFSDRTDGLDRAQGHPAPAVRDRRRSAQSAHPPPRVPRRAAASRRRPGRHFGAAPPPAERGRADCGRARQASPSVARGGFQPSCGPWAEIRPERSRHASVEPLDRWHPVPRSRATPHGGHCLAGCLGLRSHG